MYQMNIKNGKMKEVREQTEEQAQQIEKGGFLLEETPYFKEISVMVLKTYKGWKHQEFDHRETDYSQYEADDGSYISSKLCRCCKKEIKPYKENYYKKVYEYNHWYNTRIEQSSGYCKECALKKAVVINYGWNPSIAIDREFTSIRDDQEVKTQIMCDGSIIEEMTDREKTRINTN